MMNKDELLEKIEKVKLPDPFKYADEIMEAYHELDSIGSYELAILKCEYLFGRVESPLKEVFSDHILFCRECLEDIKKERDLLWAVEQFGEEIFAELLPEKPSVSPLEKVKEITKRFLEKYYPNELPNFDLAWRVFHDIDYVGPRREGISGALAATGTGEEFQDSVLPEVIICLADSMSKLETDFPDVNMSELQKAIEDIATELGTSEELVNQMKSFISESI